MAPVIMCSAPNAKTPVQLGTADEVQKFVQANPCACEVLVSRNGKRPFFEYQVKSAERLADTEILRHRCECEMELDVIVNAQDYPRLRVHGIVCTFQEGPVWVTLFRFTVTGTQLDDYVIQLRKITDGTRFNKAPSNLLSFRGATLLGDSSWLDVCAQAQDTDTLVWVVKNPDATNYERQRIEFEKTHLKIMNPIGFIRVTDDDKIQLMNRSDLFQAYENKLVGNDPFVKRWLKDPSMRTYERMDFLPPPLTCPKNVYNSWRGFAAETIQESGSADMFVEHVKILFEENAGYVFKWLANMVQFPGRKSEIALVIIGKQGAGKSSVFEHIMRKVLGEQYFGHTCCPEEDLFGRFATLTNGKILNVIDDFNVGTIKVNSDKFKTYITGDTVSFESKGVMRCPLRNCCNYVIIHNKPDPVKLDTDDRRYAVIECSTKLHKNFEYFDAFYAYAAKPENIRAVYDFLMSQDLTGVALRADRPMTSVYKRVKSLSAEKELLFLYHKVQGAAAKEIRIKGSDMFDDYQAWIIQCRFTDYKAKNKYTFKPSLDKYPGVTVEKGHAGSYTWVITCEEVVKGIEDMGFDLYDMAG